ncbi:MAG: membrane protein insertion efficiency factor YidD [Parcubacteria group bacterium]|nr:membrane protein insertion efficiency factor YidD [Parcubacteria group bacterium]
MRYIAVLLINCYQTLFSPDRGMLRVRSSTVCCFYPSCSQYAKEAIVKYGVWGGGMRALARVFRCHPWQKEWIDPLR